MKKKIRIDDEGEEIVPKSFARSFQNLSVTLFESKISFLIDLNEINGRTMM
jgi:hypothetical protein